MKRFLTVLILTMVFCAPADAAKNPEKARIKEVKSVVETLTKCSNADDLECVAKLYAPGFVCSDGFNRDIWLKLINDGRKQYSNGMYTLRIKNVSADDKYATVEVTETFFATVGDTGGIGTGDMTGALNGVYFLEKIGNEWLITAYHPTDEKLVLRYGGAKSVKMDLMVPALVAAGSNFTAALQADVPAGAVTIASIASIKSVYPQVRPDPVFRQLPEENILERVFVANKDNLNEFVVALVMITPGENAAKNKKTSEGGLATVIKRVNVVPVNKFAKLEEDEK